VPGCRFIEDLQLYGNDAPPEALGSLSVAISHYLAAHPKSRLETR
jgi:hypothetical protein